MKIFHWLSRSFRVRHRALGLYRRGMAKAKSRDHRGAIDEYTSTLTLSNLPGDVTAMVLYNRGIAYVAAGENDNGKRDLESLLAMKTAVEKIKSLARQKLARMKSRCVEVTSTSQTVKGVH